MTSKQARSALGSGTTQMVLRPAVRQSKSTPSTSQDRVRTSRPVLASSKVVPSDSSPMILRSGTYLNTPSVPVTTGKRKRCGDDNAEPTTSSKRPAKKPRPKPIPVECTICAETKSLVWNFPQLFSNCTHELKACRDCIARHTIYELESKGSWERVTCAECRAPVLREEVDSVITRKSWRHCNVIMKRKELEMNPNFRSCLSKSCSFGQVHRVGPKDNQVVTCKICKAKSCFQHKVPWHVNYTCEQYSNTPEAAITKTNEERVRQLTKKCPGEGCVWRIEKDGGCNHVLCTRCGKDFNWADVPFDEEL